MTPDFWAGKRVLLTGHTGFKGSWMALWLQSLGANVTGYALEPPTTPSLFAEAGVARGIRSITGDIRDLEALRKVFADFKPEVVLHMAAQSLVRQSYIDPVETYAVNVMGTVHLLEAARATPSVKAIVNITSDKCYENREWTWGYRENDRMGGYDPYSNSKGCAELVSAAYRSSFFNPAAYAQHGVALATVRAGNVIGGGDWAKDRLIPDLISAFERNAVVNIRNPNAIRPWQHVLEPLRGYLDVAEKLYRSGASCSNAWNFGPVDEDVRPVIWIVECMAELWGSQPKWHIDTNRQPHEANYLKLDISRAHAELGWTPALRLQEALKLIVEWARYRAARKDIRDLTLRQISAYQSLTTA